MDKNISSDVVKSGVCMGGSQMVAAMSFELVGNKTRDRFHLIKGKVENTISCRMPNAISLLRLDTDLCESTAHELEHMYTALSVGGVFINEDYGHWRGSREAADKFLWRARWCCSTARTAPGTSL